MNQFLTAKEVRKLTGWSREWLQKSADKLGLNCGRHNNKGWRRYSKSEVSQLMELRARRAEQKASA